MTDFSPAPPPLVFCSQLCVQIDAPQDFGLRPAGRRRFIPILGGTASGPMLNGRVMAGGGDWQTVDAEGAADLVARYGLVLDDGAWVEVLNRGVRHLPTSATSTPAATDAPEPGSYYFQICARLSSDAPAYDWLSRGLFVGTGQRRTSWVTIDLLTLGEMIR